jgi:hypothetical protein
MTFIVKSEDKSGKNIFREYPNQVVYEIEMYRVKMDFSGFEDEFLKHVFNIREDNIGRLKYNGAVKDKIILDVIKSIEDRYIVDIIKTLVESNVSTDINPEIIPDTDILNDFKPFEYKTIKEGVGRPKGITKRTVDRYKKVFHQFEILKKKYSSKTKAELYELLATMDYDGKTYSRQTIRNIIEDKKYNLIPSR